MNPKNLHSFMKVVEFGTFNRAAAQLRITQPALSRRISSLEAELNVELFDRHGHGVTLTDSGLVLKDHAASLLRHLDQVRTEIKSRSSVPSGSLSVGLPAPFRSILSGTLVPTYCLEYPQVKLHVSESTPRAILELLLNGLVEIGVVSREEPLAGLIAEPFLTEQLFLVGAPSSSLQLDQPVDPKRLADLQLVQAEWPSAVRSLIGRFSSDHGFTVTYNVEVDSSHLMVDVAASGHSFTVLPYSAIWEQVQSGRVCAAPLSSLKLEWVIARPMERHMSIAAQRFAEALRLMTGDKTASGEWLGASYHVAG